MLLFFFLSTFIFYHKANFIAQTVLVSQTHVSVKQQACPGSQTKHFTSGSCCCVNITIMFNHTKFVFLNFCGCLLLAKRSVVGCQVKATNWMEIVHGVCIVCSMSWYKYLPAGKHKTSFICGQTLLLLFN